MILIDVNAVLYAGVMVQLKTQKEQTIEEGMIRHISLNIIRANVRKFKEQYGEVVLCFDNRKYWRKEYFPFYKANRKKNRDESGLDWHLLFEIMGNIKTELKENFPYKCIDVDRAEADDIIGTLTAEYSSREEIIIISRDEDFLQLQKYPNVKQFSPIQQKFLVSKNPELELRQKIITGDTGDGIPNILSAGDTFVRGLRQKRMTEGRMTKFLADSVDNFDETDKIGYKRNEMLIDLSFIPEDIKKSIIDTYNNTKPAPRSKMFNYFIEKRLKNLMEVIEEF